MTPTPRPLRPRARLALGAGAWVLVLLMQCVGLLHGYAHGPLGTGHGEALAAEAASGGTAHGAQHLFDGHEAGSDECRLLDQLAHADVLWAAPATAPVWAAPAPRGFALAGGQPAAQAAGYLARGPPATA